jgi:hypothetical protein
MSTAISKETHRQILEMVAQGKSHRHIASELNIGVGTVSEYRHKPLSDIAETQLNEISDNEWRIILPKTRICTLEALVEACQIDLTLWEVERLIINKWEVGVGDDNGGVNVEPLFQVKAFLKRKQATLAAIQEIEALKKLAKADAKVPATVKPKKLTGNMLELNIPDAHFGKLAWAVETGGLNYDTKIAKKVFVDAFNTLLDRVKGYEFEEILFVVGNDLLNSDDIEGRTTSGTSLSNDGRYHKTFVTVRNVMIECVERLREVAPVKVILVSGNHDQLSVWHLGDSLECFFHNYPDVTIDNSPLPRKYHRFGNVMLMFTHGHKGKRQEYPLLMATEQPEMFGQTKYREAHTGHNHMTKLDEQHGVRVRVLPALCEPDDWHSEHAFIGNLRSAEGYVWNQDEGLVAQVFTQSTNR